MTSVEGLLLERDGTTLVATVERGDENRFSPDMLEALTDAVAEAAADTRMRFVRIRARGPVFSLGRDAPGASPPPEGAVRRAAQGIAGVFEALQTSPLVTICEVHGDAAGFGAGVAGTADVAVAAEGARFAFPEILGGYAPTVVLSWLPHAIPRRRAFEMVTTGEWIDAATALRDGLVTEVVAAGRLAERVDERIAGLSRIAPSALRDVKAFLARSRAMDPASASAASVDALVAAIGGA